MCGIDALYWTKSQLSNRCLIEAYSLLLQHSRGAGTAAGICPNPRFNKDLNVSLSKSKGYVRDISFTPKYVSLNRFFLDTRRSLDILRSGSQHKPA